LCITQLESNKEQERRIKRTPCLGSSRGAPCCRSTPALPADPAGTCVFVPKLTDCVPQTQRVNLGSSLVPIHSSQIPQEPVCVSGERDFLFTGPNPLNHRDAFSGSAVRHGTLNSLFQVAVYLPSSVCSKIDRFLPHSQRINLRIGLDFQSTPELLADPAGTCRGYLAHKKKVLPHTTPIGR